MKTAKVYLEGQLVRITTEGALVYRFRVVPGGFLDDLCEIEDI